MSKPVVLCILDGWGISQDTNGNAPALADTPNFDQFLATCPNAQLITHGPVVGLPKGQMGNSEVGHTNIGAGRTVAMDLGQIDLAIEDESYFDNAPLNTFAAKLAETGGRAHLFSVLSDGGVHGHINHLKASIAFFAKRKTPVVLHVITDGRDVAPKSVLGYFESLKDLLSPDVVIGTICGRYFAMDRDNRWERVKLAYDAIVNGDGPKIHALEQAVSDFYEGGITDEFFTPSVFSTYQGMTQNDGVYCLNFRADRARELFQAIGNKRFSEFQCDPENRPGTLLGMVSYSSHHDTFMDVAFPKKAIKNTLGEWVATQGKRQFRLAETEKYPHVTFFLNGGNEVPYDGEDRFMPLSPKVATYDLAPAMSAGEVTDKLLSAISAKYDLIVVNFANPDMVGHTGDLGAAIASCEAVDRGLGAAIEALDAVDGTMLVIADHGNCEMMIDPETGGAHTAHTTNPVPCILVNGPENATLTNGILADVAPTILTLMGLPIPSEMTGKVLTQ